MKFDALMGIMPLLDKLSGPAELYCLKLPWLSPYCSWATDDAAETVLQRYRRDSLNFSQGNSSDVWALLEVEPFGERRLVDCLDQPNSKSTVSVGASRFREALYTPPAPKTCCE